MPPPGFQGALPKALDEYRSPPAVLTFERKKNYRRDFEERQMRFQGGISLGVAREQSQRVNEKKKNKKKCTVEVYVSSEDHPVLRILSWRILTN